MCRPLFSLPRRALALVGAALVMLSSRAGATWSIVVVDTATGEVAIGCATCLTGLDLEIYVPVMLTGIGGACAQARIDGGRNRMIIWDEMMKGTSPGDILDILRGVDGNHSQRQYGIVDLRGRRRSFTGRDTIPWAGGVVGDVGSLHYAIQGNILTGPSVVDEAERALVDTQGDLGQKLMAAMEAAYAQGGDSRCTGAGKTAHVGFMMTSRVGDIDGTCSGSVGCANGTYYMNLNVANQTGADPDPVLQLRILFDAWRAALAGHPDHVLTQKSFTRPSLPGNGTAKTTLDIALFDVDGNAIPAGGASLFVAHAADSAGLSRIGGVVDHGDGTYAVEITAGAGQGIDRFDVLVDDGSVHATLYPRPELTLSETLLASAADLSASAGGSVDLSLIGPEHPVGRHYLLLASASGTDPGLPIGTIVLPLNLDLVLLVSYLERNGANFVDTEGTLLADGTGLAQFTVGPGQLNPLIGGELSFAYLTLAPIDFPSSFVKLVVVP